MKEKAKYISGIVRIQSTVDSKTETDAKSASPPNLIANIAVLVAQGVENKKKTVYLTTSFTGKKATASIVIIDINTSFIPQTK